MIMDCVVLLISMLVGVRAQCPVRSYNDSGKCVSCPVHCTFCNSSNFCFQCDNNYSGADCSQLCARCKTDTRCGKVNGICEESCEDGLSGQYCDKQCESRCGSCLRNDTTKCLDCDVTCALACPESCYSEDCQSSNCTRSCVPGYWGCSCRNECPEKTKEGKKSAVIENVIVPFVSTLLVALLGIVLVLLYRKRRQCKQPETQTPSTDYETVTEEDLMCNKSVQDASEGREKATDTLAPAVPPRKTEFQYINDQFSRNKDRSYFSSLGQDKSWSHKYKFLNKAAHSGIENSAYQCQLATETLTVYETTEETEYEDTV